MRPPSQSKGLVTTPTVRMPFLGHVRAITGAAPVPCHRHASGDEQRRRRRSLRIFIHGRPRPSRAFSGLLPGPRPLAPRLNWMVLLQRACQAWPSRVGSDELHALDERLIMCSTALPPPPPTPITLICVPVGTPDFNHFNASLFLLKSVLQHQIKLLSSGQFMKAGRCTAIAHFSQAGPPRPALPDRC